MDEDEVDAGFAAFVNACSVSLGTGLPTLTSNRHLIDVDGRWIELKFDTEERRVSFISLVLLQASTLRPRADLIGAFNAYNLFNGGHSLVATEDGSIYLVQPCRLASLAASDMGWRLRAFATRADEVTFWYLDSLAQPDHVAEPR